MGICVLNRHQAQQWEFHSKKPDCRCHWHKSYGEALDMVEAGLYRWCSPSGDTSRRRITEIPRRNRMGNRLPQGEATISAKESALSAEYCYGQTEAASAHAKVQTWPHVYDHRNPLPGATRDGQE